MVQRKQRLNRRRLLAATGLVGAGLAAWGMAGCSSKGTTSSSASKPGGSATPKRGGTLNISFDFTRGFDPHRIQASDSSLFGLFYSKLIRANPKTYAIEPDLAAKWETPSHNEIVFTLAPNIRWHDKPPANGRPLTGDDVVFSLNRLQTNDPEFVNRSFLAGIEKVEAVDSDTVRLTLKQPNVAQMANLTQSSMEILAPEVVDAAKGNFSSAGTAVGTGAFILKSSEPNVGSLAVHNTNYFKQGLPYLDQVQIRAFQDSEAEWAAFLSGQIDHRWVPGQGSTKFTAEKANQYEFTWFGDIGYDIVQAHTKKKPFDDARVTRALRLLIDHKEAETAWAEVWFGRGRDSQCFGAGTADNWDLTEQEYQQHLEWKLSKDDAVKEALSLLSATGFTKDKPLRFTISGLNTDYQQASVQLLQAQFKRLSQGVVDPDLKVYESATWTKVRVNGDFQYFTSGHTVGGTDPDTYFSSTYQTGGGRNYGKMSDPKLDEMFAKQRTIFDDAQRKQAVRDIVLYMIDNIPYTTFSNRYILNAAQARVKDFPAEGTTNKFGDYYETIWVNG